MANKSLSGGLFSGKPLVPKESAISASIEQYLDMRRIYNLRLNSGKAILKFGGVITLCPEGTPDRFCLYRGVPLFIEVKMAGKKPTKIQKDMHDKIRASGALVITAESIDDVKKELEKIDISK